MVSLLLENVSYLLVMSIYGQSYSYATSTTKFGADQGAIMVRSTVGDASVPAEADACFKWQSPTVTRPRIALNILGGAVMLKCDECKRKRGGDELSYTQRMFKHEFSPMKLRILGMHCSPIGVV